MFDPEKPYVEAGDREAEFDEAKEKATEEFWFNIDHGDNAEKLVSEWIDDPEALLAGMLKKIGSYECARRKAHWPEKDQPAKTPEEVEKLKADLRGRLVDSLMAMAETAFDSHIEREAEEIQEEDGSDDFDQD